VPLSELPFRSYKVSLTEEFAHTILEGVVKFELGVGKWLPLNEMFVERLGKFHSIITPYVHKPPALSQKLILYFLEPVKLRG